MSVYIDTSAFLALLNAKDINYQKGKAVWEDLVAASEIVITSNYVLVETHALAQRRFGAEAVASFQENVVPALEIEWVDEPTHQAGIAAVCAASRRGLSLVDCVSFVVMRREGLGRVFAFDPHFQEQGFEVIPPYRERDAPAIRGK